MGIRFYTNETVELRLNGEVIPLKNLSLEFSEGEPERPKGEDFEFLPPPERPIKDVLFDLVRKIGEEVAVDMDRRLADLFAAAPGERSVVSAIRKFSKAELRWFEDAREDPSHWKNRRTRSVDGLHRVVKRFAKIERNAQRDNPRTSTRRR